MTQLRVSYKREHSPVQLGDHVRVRIWWRRKPGRVVYVPGISAPNPTMEFNGLSWVAVNYTDGLILVLVDPKTGVLQGRVSFVNRGDAREVQLIGPTDDPEQGRSFPAL